MSLALSWLLLAAAGPSGRPIENSINNIETLDTLEVKELGWLQKSLSGASNMSNSKMEILPTIFGAKGITKEDLQYFRDSERNFMTNQTSSTFLMPSATSPTSPDIVTDPTLSSAMCSDLDSFYLSYRDVHGYMSLIICILGSIANLLNIVVLTRKDMNTSPINRILTGMAVADILLILEYIPYVTHHDLWIEGREIEEQYSFAWSAYMWFHANFSVVIHNVSIWLTLTVAVWRFIMIRYHTLAPVYCTMPRCHLLILSAYVVPVFLTIPNYIAMDIVANEITVNRTTGAVDADGVAIYSMDNVTKYVINFNELAMANDKLLYRMNICLYSFILKLVPSIVLTVITGFLIHALYKAEERSARLKEGRKLSTPVTAGAAGLPTGRRISQMQHSSQHLELGAQQQQHQLGGATLTPGQQGSTSTAAVQTASNHVKIVALNGTIGNSARNVSRRAKPSSRRKSTDRTTRLLIVILVLFLLTEFPQGILGMLSTINDNFFYKCYSPLGDLMDDIALINSSINFIIYCFMSKQFRKTFLETFGLVEYCSKIHCPSLRKIWSRFTGVKNSSLLQCELGDVEVAAPQELQPMLAQPGIQENHLANHYNDDEQIIERHLINGEKTTAV